VVVPDYPPRNDLLPPAPTSPSVDTVPFTGALVAPAPVSPIDAAPPAVAVPAVPAVGQPRFSVPGLEHVVVEGTEPEPVGPIGYRTPARFAHQRPAVTAVAAAPTPTRSFDAVIAPPARAGTPAPTPDGLRAPGAPRATLPLGAPPATPPPAATPPGTIPPTNAPSGTVPPAAAPSGTIPLADAPSGTVPSEESAGPVGGEPRLQAGATDLVDVSRTRGPAIGATSGALLGAVAGLATLGLAAWWFLQPATVHGVGVALGAIALVLSVVTSRNPAATWQRPIALLGAVLGGVGTVGLLWAVAAALLPTLGVTLPDLTGTGTTPTLAP
jgi:hypothetical protein